MILLAQGYNHWPLGLQSNVNFKPSQSCIYMTPRYILNSQLVFGNNILHDSQSLAISHMRPFPHICWVVHDAGDTLTKLLFKIIHYIGFDWLMMVSLIIKHSGTNRYWKKTRRNFAYCPPT